MKKYLLFFAAILITAMSVIADDAKFYNALQNCTSYSDGGTTTTEGKTVKFRNTIVGWQSDKCVYKETVNYGGMDVCITCKLSKPQLTELVDVMKAYSTVQKYTGENIDTSSLSAVKNNPVVGVWNKYLQDPSVCQMELPEELKNQ